MEWQSEVGSSLGNNAKTLTKACLADLFYHTVDDLSHLTMDVGAGPVNWKFRQGE